MLLRPPRRSTSRLSVFENHDSGTKKDAIPPSDHIEMRVTASKLDVL